VQPAYIETVRIFNVNINDWSVDCISEHGNKRYFDIQVMSPYFHFTNGEGMYAMPEVGAVAWLCVPSTGRMVSAFLLGFQAPFDETDVSYRSGRQNLNPGDMMFRTRDENFIILRRGGVIQIGATPTAQRLYVPLRNFIQDFCENYKLSAFGGEMFWETQRDDQTRDGSALTKFYLKTKQKANDPQHIAELTMGSHGEDDPLTIDLTVWTDGTDAREARVSLQITNEGDVAWNIEKDWTQNITGKYTITAEGDVSIDTQGAVAITAQGDAALESAGGNLALAATGSAGMTGGTVATVDAPVVKMGEAAVSQAVKGTELHALLTALAAAIDAASSSGPLAPMAGAATAITTALPSILSAKVKVE
jgi:hypothetical protein